MAYFDNAATTFPKPECVYKEMDSFYRGCGGSAGRGDHAGAKSAGALIADVKENLQKLLHCPAKQVIFTHTATIALNMIIQGLISDGARTFYISPFEHNAVTRTLHHYEKCNQIQVATLSVNTDLEYDLMRIRYQFDDAKPDVVIISHASNVIGLVAPVEKIFKIAKVYDAITVVDMAQTAGLVDLNAGLSTIDFAVFDGHKTLYAPTGIAGFVMNPERKLPAVLFGGTGYDSANQDMPDSIPERYEMGTQNIVGVAGLHASLTWLEALGMEELLHREQDHRRRLIALLSSYPFVRLIGIKDGLTYVGIVSCVIGGVSSDTAGSIFDRCGISVRTGLHCAPLAHQFLGTYPAGTIRFSVSYFTSESDFIELEAALDYIEENL